MAHVPLVPIGTALRRIYERTFAGHRASLLSCEECPPSRRTLRSRAA